MTLERRKTELFIIGTMLATLANTECQQIKGKLHSCNRFVRTSEKYSDLMEMTFDDEEEDFLVTFFLANQPPKVTLLILEAAIKCTLYAYLKFFTVVIIRKHWFK